MPNCSLFILLSYLNMLQCIIHCIVNFCYFYHMYFFPTFCYICFIILSTPTHRTFIYSFIYISKPFDVICREHNPILLNTQNVCSKNKNSLLYNQSEMIKFKKFYFDTVFYLIYNPHSNFTSCPNSVLYSNSFPPPSI